MQGLRRLTSAVFVFAFAVLFLRGTGFAQDFEAGIISLDILETDADDAAEPLLIAAYQPQSVAPVISSVDGTGLTAIRTPQGLPAPSIILGRIDPGQEEDFGIEGLLPDTVDSSAFSFDDLEARAALRASDPELYRKLVSGGHIDPPEQELIRALQTELSRSNCYRSTIDGDWGRGSRRSVTAYFDALGDDKNWPDQEPTVELFRELLFNEDVRCVVASRPAPATTTQRRRPAASTQNRPSAARPEAPTSSTPSNASRPRVGGGVFR